MAHPGWGVEEVVPDSVVEGKDAPGVADRGAGENGGEGEEEMERDSSRGSRGKTSILLRR